MPEQLTKVDADRQAIVEAKEKGLCSMTRTYLRLSGPGWLQSALTLGGGSLASSLFLGVLAGFGLLWLQPVAMILGIIMLSAIGYVAMSTSERPFQAINRHVNPVLGWGWALASLAANMVWALPQYSLASGVLQQNLMPGVLGPESALGATVGDWFFSIFPGLLGPETVVADIGGKIVISAAILAITMAITFTYDSGGWGIKLYELMLKLVVAGIVMCFVGVVGVLALKGDLAWGEIARGFIPDLTKLYRPAESFNWLLDAVPDGYRDFWVARIVAEQRDVMISAAATAVGINMTFLLPYSMLRRGWDKTFRGLAIFDLSTGMFIPFVLATSCVVIASATQFHPNEAVEATLLEEGDLPELPEDTVQGLAEARLAHTNAAQAEPLNRAEVLLASHLQRKDAFDLAKSLKPLTGDVVADVIFGIGVLGMTLSSITLLMLISGFVICEMLGLPPTGWPNRIGTLAAATGVLGPFLWSGTTRFWLAVPTSVFGMVLLPIAYITFFCMMNSKNLLGDNMPRGGRRVAWNTSMGIAAAAALSASVYMVWVKTQYYGLAGVGAFLALVLFVHFAFPRKSAASNE
ncbi:MAG: divalent metal cation transporter [Thermoguttaceae bacterium]